jgi:hypothetical protein
VLEAEDAMSEPLTDDELAAAKALVDAATPGPWSAANGKGSACVRTEDRATSCAIYLNVRTCEVDECVERWHRDAAFIAASRTLVPRLLAEIARLRVQNAALRNSVYDLGELYESERAAFHVTDDEIAAVVEAQEAEGV